MRSDLGTRHPAVPIAKPRDADVLAPFSTRQISNTTLRAVVGRHSLDETLAETEIQTEMAMRGVATGSPTRIAMRNERPGLRSSVRRTIRNRARSGVAPQ